MATPTWTYNPPVVVNGNVEQPAEVVAAIPAPELEIPPNKEFGEPVWMKVIKTTTHNPDPVALEELISDDLDGDNLADWQNREPDEVESEWTLVQNRADGGDVVEALAPDEMGDGNEVVTRRYEFYRYVDTNPIGAGSIDGETGEAMCDKVAPDGVHGEGTRPEVTNAAGDPTRSIAPRWRWSATTPAPRWPPSRPRPRSGSSTTCRTPNRQRRTRRAPW